MKTHRLVKSEDLNHYGHLFGGRLLAWVDEASWIAASIEYPHCRFVTIGMEQASFHHPVQAGAILAIDAVRETEGRTSVCYSVTVETGGNRIFSTRVSFVNIDQEGAKTPLTQ